MHVPNVNHINMVNSNNFAVTVVTPIIIGIVIIMMGKYHDVAMRCSWIDDILIPSNVICGVVESSEVVMIDSVTLKKN